MLLVILAKAKVFQLSIKLVEGYRFVTMKLLQYQLNYVCNGAFQNIMHDIWGKLLRNHKVRYE